MWESSPVQYKRFTSSPDIFNFNKRIAVKDYKQQDQQKKISDGEQFCGTDFENRKCFWKELWFYS